MICFFLLFSRGNFFPFLKIQSPSIAISFWNFPGLPLRQAHLPLRIKTKPKQNAISGDAFGKWRQIFLSTWKSVMPRGRISFKGNKRKKTLSRRKSERLYEFDHNLKQSRRKTFSFEQHRTLLESKFGSPKLKRRSNLTAPFADRPVKADLWLKSESPLLLLYQKLDIFNRKHSLQKKVKQNHRNPFESSTTNKSRTLLSRVCKRFTKFRKPTKTGEKIYIW